jgi:DNA polymerase-4
MHIDLNSCFATIEAQANRLLRDRPVGVAAYDTPRGFVLAANYIAKSMGVKLGVNVAEARILAPGIVIMTPDPAKYREAHKRFREVLLEYSSEVTPKSIDEFVIDMKNTPKMRAGMSMIDIGYEIKEKIYERLGEAVTVNVGIGPNRFLAKYAAGFNKPNGLTQIDHTNLEEKLENMDLIDLPGINTRYRARLQLHGITTPLDFLHADRAFLKKIVFRSVVGEHWYLRLRGYEVDNRVFARKSIGHQHALSNKTTDIDELCRLLLKLSEKSGRRLRKNNLYAGGIHLYMGFDAPRYGDNHQDIGPSSFENMQNIRSWHHGEKVGKRLYSTEDIYAEAKRLLLTAPIAHKVKILSVTVFDVMPWNPEQGNLFEVPDIRNESLELKGEFKKYLVNKRLSDALDEVNDRYGEYVVVPASMMDMKGTILDRIAFGSLPDITN